MSAITPEDIWDFCSWLTFLYTILLVTVVLCMPRRKAYIKHIVYPSFARSSLELNTPVIVASFVIYFFLAFAPYFVWSDGGWNAHPFALLLFVVYALLEAFNDGIYYHFYPFYAHFVFSLFNCLLLLVTTVCFFLVDTYAGAILLGLLLIDLLGSFLSYKLYVLNGTVYNGPTPKCLIVGDSLPVHTSAAEAHAHALREAKPASSNSVMTSNGARHVGAVGSQIYHDPIQRAKHTNGDYAIPPGFVLSTST